MKKESLFLALTPTSIGIIPKLIEHFGKAIQKVRKNVFNLQVGKKDIEDYMKSLRIPEGTYQIGLGEVSRWPFSLKYSNNVISENDLSKCPYCGKEMKYAKGIDKKAGFIQTLVLGSLKSLKVASTLSFNFGLIKIVKILETWVKNNYGRK